MSLSGKEENVEKAHEKAIEEDIERDARKAENIKYQEEKRKVAIKAAEQRAVKRANQPSMLSGIASFAQNFAVKPQARSRKSSYKPLSVTSFTGFGGVKPSKRPMKMPDIMGLYGKKKGKGRMPNINSMIKY